MTDRRQEIQTIVDDTINRLRADHPDEEQYADIITVLTQTLIEGWCYANKDVDEVRKSVDAVINKHMAQCAEHYGGLPWLMVQRDGNGVVIPHTTPNTKH